MTSIIFLLRINKYKIKIMKRSVKIDNLVIGAGQPVRVESMLKTRLNDRDACVAQCESLLKHCPEPSYTKI